MNESLLDDLGRTEDAGAAGKIAASTDDVVDTQYLTLPEWYSDWQNRGYYHLFLIEIPFFNSSSIDYISKFRRFDKKIRALFELVANQIRMSELVAVSFCSLGSDKLTRFQELIDSGELLLEPGGIKGVSIDKWVESKYFYKFFANEIDLRKSIKNLLKLFAVIGNICEETTKQKYYNITFKIVEYDGDGKIIQEYDQLRAWGLWAFDILRGENIKDESVYSLAFQLFNFFGLLGKYGKSENDYVYPQLLDIWKRKKDIRRRLNESVLDSMEAQDTRYDDLFDNETEMSYQEWYRHNTCRYTHLFVMYKYFCGKNRAEEIPMVKEMFRHIVERYYPDCSDVQVVSTQMSFYEEDRECGVQYEPPYRLSGGVILDGLTDTVHYEPCFKICVNAQPGRPRDFERFLDCVASMYALANWRDSGDYRGGKIEIYSKKHPDDNHFIHNQTKYGINDIVGVDAYNYKFD